MEFLPGVSYVTCKQCQGRGRVQVASPELPLTRTYNSLTTQFALSMVFVAVGLIALPALRNASPWELARQGILAIITVLALSIAGGFAIPWILQVLTTRVCPACRGGGWTPGEIPKG